MLTQTYTHAEPMACSVTAYGDQRDMPLDDTDVDQAMTLAAFGMEELDVDYFVSDDKITITGIRVQGVELLAMFDLMHAKYWVPWARQDRMVGAIERIEMLVREQLEKER